MKNSTYLSYLPLLSKQKDTYSNEILVYSIYDLDRKVDRVLKMLSMDPTSLKFEATVTTPQRNLQFDQVEQL